MGVVKVTSIILGRIACTHGPPLTTPQYVVYLPFCGWCRFYRATLC